MTTKRRKAVATAEEGKQQATTTTSSSKASPRARQQGMVFKGIDVDEFAKYRKEQLARHRRPVERKEGELPPPVGSFGMLAEAARCNQNRDCLAPILPAGRYAWVFGKGPRNGTTLCVTCALEQHPELEPRWEAVVKRMGNRVSEAEVRRMAKGETTDRTRRRAMSRMG